MIVSVRDGNSPRTTIGRDCTPTYGDTNGLARTANPCLLSRIARYSRIAPIGMSKGKGEIFHATSVASSISNGQKPNGIHDTSDTSVIGAKTRTTSRMPPRWNASASQNRAMVNPACGLDSTKNSPICGGMIRPRGTKKSILPNHTIHHNCGVSSISATIYHPAPSRLIENTQADSETAINARMSTPGGRIANGASGISTQGGLKNSGCAYGSPERIASRKTRQSLPYASPLTAGLVNAGIYEANAKTTPSASGRRNAADLITNDKRTDMESV